MEFLYLFRHEKDGDLEEKFFSTQDIEDGKAKECIEIMKEDGYILEETMPFNES